ncbi:MAG: hypothetical protein QNK37_15500 [Acidobacteriota bacterium]|nr:hypothetical protein [Acidobacteriota bacterium]
MRYLLLLFFFTPLVQAQEQKPVDDALPAQIDMKRIKKKDPKLSPETLRKLQTDLASPQADKKNRAIAQASVSAKTLRVAGLRQGDREKTEQAVVLYRGIIENGNTQEKITARNDLAVLYLQTGDATKAYEQMSRVDIQQAPQHQRFALRYNQGQALEKTGRTKEALTAYRRSFSENTKFVKAASSAMRLLRQSDEPTRFRDIADLSKRLVDQGKPEIARTHLMGAIRENPGNRGLYDLKSGLVELHYRDFHRPERYRKEMRPEYRQLVEAAPDMKKAVDQLDRAYLGDLSPVLVDMDRTYNLFSEWIGWQTSPTFSKTMKRIGDDYRLQGNSKQALTRYIAAWRIDPEDTEAPLHAANLLRDHPGLDDKNRTILNSLVRTIFAEKGRDYSKKDYRNILRKHLLLATLFEREQKWGNSSNPLSVIFQLEHAIEAREQLRERKPSPGLYERLGRAERQRGNLSKAVDAELTAVQGYLELEKPESAEPLLQRLRRQGDLTRDQKRTLRDLWNRHRRMLAD